MGRAMTKPGSLPEARRMGADSWLCVTRRLPCLCTFFPTPDCWPWLASLGSPWPGPGPLCPGPLSAWCGVPG